MGFTVTLHVGFKASCADTIQTVGHALIRNIWLDISNFALTIQISKSNSLDLYEISKLDRPLGEGNFETSHRINL